MRSRSLLLCYLVLIVLVPASPSSYTFAVDIVAVGTGMEIYEY